MNTAIFTPALNVTTTECDAESNITLIFVDDASYEFVGGGMAANGI